MRIDTPHDYKSGDSQVINALCPFPFRATLKFGAVSGSPSRERYTIPGSDAVTTSPGCQFKLTIAYKNILQAWQWQINTIANWLTYKILRISRIWKYNHIFCQRTMFRITWNLKKVKLLISFIIIGL